MGVQALARVRPRDRRPSNASRHTGISSPNPTGRSPPANTTSAPDAVACGALGQPSSGCQASRRRRPRRVRRIARPGRASRAKRGAAGRSSRVTGRAGCQFPRRGYGPSACPPSARALDGDMPSLLARRAPLQPRRACRRRQSIRRSTSCWLTLAGHEPIRRKGIRESAGGRAEIFVTFGIAERLVAGTACEATPGDRVGRFHGERSQPAAGQA